MTTKQLTNEELRQIVDSHEKGYGMCVPVNCDYLMAKELMAVREAQPVYLPEPNNRHPSLAGKAERDYLRGRNETLKECIYTLKKCGICITHVKPGARMSSLVMPECATPPAPAVPAAITADNAPEIFEIAAQVERIGLSGAYGAYASGWNACRAAMLNHSGGSTEKVPDDTRRMNWLVAHHVEVRKPLLYGSEKFFTAQTLTDREDDYHATSLREQIDAAMAAAPTPTKAGE